MLPYAEAVLGYLTRRIARRSVPKAATERTNEMADELVTMRMDPVTTYSAAKAKHLHSSDETEMPVSATDSASFLQLGPIIQ